MKSHVNAPHMVPGLEIRDIDGEVVVFDARSRKLHILNANAGCVLRLCDGTRTTEQVARAFADVARRSEAYGDALRVLATFQELDLLEGITIA